MCNTRIKVIDEYDENIADFEELINEFISNPKNKVAKVNSVKTKIYHDDLDNTCLLAIITYELGD